VLTGYSVRAGHYSDDNALPSVSFFVDLYGSPIRKFILNPIQKLYIGVEILAEIWNAYRRVYKMPVMAKLLLQWRLLVYTSSLQGSTLYKWGKYSAHHH
jgi:hypothetical protein